MIFIDCSILLTAAAVVVEEGDVAAAIVDNGNRAADVVDYGATPSDVATSDAIIYARAIASCKRILIAFINSTS